MAEEDINDIEVDDNEEVANDDKGDYVNYIIHSLLCYTV